MPALQQITEWLASRDGGTASRFTDPVVSEAPITKQTLGDIMDRLMKNRKVPAEVPPATVPAEVPPAAVETPQPATPAPSAAGKPVTAATLMEEVAKPDSFQELRDMIKERAGKKVPPFDWTDEAQFQEYQKALVEDSNIYGNNRTTMADRVTRFMKKNGIEPTDSGIVRALNESAEDIAVSPTTGLKRPSFNAADHEVLFDMIKDRLETPTGGNPAASAAPKPPAKPRSKRTTVGDLMEKAKSAEPTIEAEAELVAPKIIDAPRSLSKLYGSNWMERADAAELKSAFNKATRARTKSLEAYRKYVEESNRRFYASKEYNSPEAAARRNEIAKDTNERLARIAEAKPSWRKK